MSKLDLKANKPTVSMGFSQILYAKKTDKGYSNWYALEGAISADISTESSAITIAADNDDAWFNIANPGQDTINMTLATVTETSQVIMFGKKVAKEGVLVDTGEAITGSFLIAYLEDRYPKDGGEPYKVYHFRYNCKPQPFNEGAATRVQGTNPNTPQITFTSTADPDLKIKHVWVYDTDANKAIFDGMKAGGTVPEDLIKAETFKDAKSGDEALTLGSTKDTGKNQ